MSIPIEKRRDQDAQRAWFMRVLAQLQSGQWYGTVEVKLEGGSIRLVTKTETLLPPKPGDVFNIQEAKTVS